MNIHINEVDRKLKEIEIKADLVIAGGGLSGTCGAITAAREGLKVVLIQDRPVLGGNSSSEVRLWALGATSHMGNNNRWSREGGVINEIVMENLHRNPEGNPVLYDAVLLDKVFAEKNITLLLDTAVFQISQDDNTRRIQALKAFCSQSATMYSVSAPLFCDASGDGILGYLAGADYRVGAEGKDEFDEPLAPDHYYGELLGDTIYFYTKDTGSPVEFVAPDFALKDISRIPRADRIKASDTGCSFWWLEYGGRKDTIHDNQEIKKELWKVCYGVWDHIKNSGKFPEAANLTLEWVGMIPGKRESRRFEGDYMLRQSDIVEQKTFDDAVSFGGWAVDLHPADGVYSDLPPCSQYHSKGVYQIPWRCYYSRNVPNLFLTGRLISASHVAFGSTRVMMTSAHGAQAVAVGAALCLEKEMSPGEMIDKGCIRELQTRLVRTGQYIPFLEVEDTEDFIPGAHLEGSSTLALSAIPGSGVYETLSSPRALLMPLPSGELPALTLSIRSEEKQDIRVQLRKSEKPDNFTPEIILEEQKISFSPGDRELRVHFNHREAEDFYGFLVIMPEHALELEVSETRIPGFLSLYHELNDKVAKSVIQESPAGSGIHSFEFWLPRRSPGGKLPAVKLNPPLTPFSAEGVGKGYERPSRTNRGWVPGMDEAAPVLSARWESPVRISRILLSFDGDYDHAMETVQIRHHDRHIPSCVRHFRIKDQNGTILTEVKQNYQSRGVIELPAPVELTSLNLEIISTWGSLPAVFRMRAYS